MARRSRPLQLISVLARRTGHPTPRRESPPVTSPRADLSIAGRSWRWRVPPPPIWRVLGIACAANLITTFALLATVSWWGTKAPTQGGAAAIQMKGGTYYGPPGLVLYTKAGLPIGFALLGAMALVAWTRRQDLERVS